MIDEARLVSLCFCTTKNALNESRGLNRCKVSTSLNINGETSVFIVFGQYVSEPLRQPGDAFPRAWMPCLWQLPRGYCLPRRMFSSLQVEFLFVTAARSTTSTTTFSVGTAASLRTKSGRSATVAKAQEPTIATFLDTSHWPRIFSL